MRPAGVKLGIDFDIEKGYKNLQFKVGEHLRISKNKNIFAKGYIPNWSEKFLFVKTVKNTVLLTYVIEDLKMKKLWELFTRRNFKIPIKQSLGLERYS